MLSKYKLFLVVFIMFVLAYAASLLVFSHCANKTGAKLNQLQHEMIKAQAYREVYLKEIEKLQLEQLAAIEKITSIQIQQHEIIQTTLIKYDTIDRLNPDDVLLYWKQLLADTLYINR